MKGRGLVFILLGVGLMAASGPALGWVSGTGKVDISRSIVNRMEGFERFSSITGDGSLQIGAAANEGYNLENGTSGKTAVLSYTGDVPLVGLKRMEMGSALRGTKTSIQEAFSVTDMEKEETTSFGTGSSQLVGTESKLSFNGTYMTSSNSHQLFVRDVSSHQRYTGSFEIDSMIRFGDLADRRPSIALAILPQESPAEVGGVVTRNYRVVNTGTVPVQGVTLIDSRAGPVPLSKADLRPGEAALGTASFVVEEEDLPGPLNDSIQVTAADLQGNLASASAIAVVNMISTRSLNLTVTASEPCARLGDDVAIIYSIENLGDLPIVGLNMTDSVGGGPVSINLTLMPGESLSLAANCTLNETNLQGLLNNSVSVWGITSAGEAVGSSAEIFLPPC